jgi:hypothetical protein
MLLLDRFISGGIFVSALLSILLLLTGTCVPLALQALYTGYFRERFDIYTAILSPSPFCILWGIESNELLTLPVGVLPWLGQPAVSIPAELLLVGGASLAMFLVNMLLAAREVDRQRIATPQRVIEEEQSLHPQGESKPAPSSPWELADGKN